MSAPTGRDSRDLSAVLRAPRRLDADRRRRRQRADRRLRRRAEARLRRRILVPRLSRARGRPPHSGRPPRRYVELAGRAAAKSSTASASIPSIVTASLKAVLSGVLRLLAREGRSGLNGARRTDWPLLPARNAARHDWPRAQPGDGAGRHGVWKISRIGAHHSPSARLSRAPGRDRSAPTIRG